MKTRVVSDRVAALVVPLAILVTVCGVPRANGASAAPEKKAIPSSQTSLRVCAAANEMPYSNEDRDGFENRLAQVLGETLKLPVNFVWSSRPAIYLVKEQLDTGACDVVMGLDTGDPRVLTTRPYYRSGYVFVYRKDRGWKIDDWNSPDLMRVTRIAISDGTPAEPLLRRLGKYDDNLNYMYSLVDYKSRRNQYVRYEPTRLVNEVVDGRADIGILWGPEVARYVKRATVPLEMAVIPNYRGNDGEAIAFQYEQSLAVREGDTKLLGRLNDAIAAAQPRIDAVLREEGVPLLPVSRRSASSTPVTHAPGRVD